MADQPVVHIGENSPEEVAYKLFKHIVDIEAKALTHSPPSGGRTPATREWVLSTYRDCFLTVKGHKVS